MSLKSALMRRQQGRPEVNSAHCDQSEKHNVKPRAPITAQAVWVEQALFSGMFAVSIARASICEITKIQYKLRKAILRSINVNHLLKTNTLQSSVYWMTEARLYISRHC